jgi:hypothetical protein
MEDLHGCYRKRRVKYMMSLQLKSIPQTVQLALLLPSYIRKEHGHTAMARRSYPDRLKRCYWGYWGDNLDIRWFVAGTKDWW